ncbi:hypothetical protein [Neorhodopirellula pilleata]|uniref:Pilus assembly protein, PilO n=1 Tax=Neorhodopirellula pilleata TaxID=2714738 RepID=A0A5C6A4J2_9BACT|nr:hypothetical protein [Neorhodopirellula pilleata]TWT94218.1 hypothetical protein Pla100_38280 [Neorhodopirellula pilleata]
MSRSVRMLSAALVASLLFGLSSSGPMDWITGPIAHQQVLLTDAKNSLRAKELEMRRAEISIAQLQDKRSESLHRDPSKAQVSYQEYLIRMSDRFGLESVVVSSGQPEAVEGLGHLLHFNIEGAGATSSIGKWIDGFFRTETLHRLARLQVYQSLGPDSPTHRFAMNVEVLTLASGSDGPDVLPVRLPPVGVADDLFASHDIFRRPQPKIAKAVETSPSTASIWGNFLAQLPKSSEPDPERAAPKTKSNPPEPKPDPRKSVRFVGVIGNGNSRVAMFMDSRNGKRFALGRNETLTSFGINSEIVQIQSNSIVLEGTDLHEGHAEEVNVSDAVCLYNLSLGALLAEATLQPVYGKSPGGR